MLEDKIYRIEYGFSREIREAYKEDNRRIDYDYDWDEGETEEYWFNFGREDEYELEEFA